MGLRPGRCYTKIHRPYTRQSRRRPRKGYVKGVPKPKITVFEAGTKDNYKNTIFLISKDHKQIRHNALESARVAVTQTLEKHISKGEKFFFKTRVYPHHILRENAMETETRENQTTGDVELPPKSPTATEIFSETKLDIPIIEISENKKSEKTSAQLGRQGEKIIDIQENRNNFSISSPEKKQILKNFVILHGDNRYVSTMLDINKLTMENLFYLLENQCIIDEVKLEKKEYNLYFEKKKEDLIIDNLSIPSASPSSPSFFEFD